METRIYLAVLALLLLVPLVSTAHACQTIQSVEKKLVEKWPKLKSMFANTALDKSRREVVIQHLSTIEALFNDGKQRFGPSPTATSRSMRKSTPIVLYSKSLKAFKSKIRLVMTPSPSNKKPRRASLSLDVGYEPITPRRQLVSFVLPVR